MLIFCLICYKSILQVNIKYLELKRELQAETIMVFQHTGDLAVINLTQIGDLE